MVQALLVDIAGNLTDGAGRTSQALDLEVHLCGACKRRLEGNLVNNSSLNPGAKRGEEAFLDLGFGDVEGYLSRWEPQFSPGFDC